MCGHVSVYVYMHKYTYIYIYACRCVLATCPKQGCTRSVCARNSLRAHAPPKRPPNQPKQRVDLGAAKTMCFTIENGPGVQHAAVKSTFLKRAKNRPTKTSISLQSGAPQVHFHCKNTVFLLNSRSRGGRRTRDKKSTRVCSVLAVFIKRSKSNKKQEQA